MEVQPIQKDKNKKIGSRKGQHDQYTHTRQIAISMYGGMIPYL